VYSSIIIAEFARGEDGADSSTQNIFSGGNLNPKPLNGQSSMQTLNHYIILK